MLYLDGVESNLRILQELWRVQLHETALFPDDTDKTCTLTAAEAADTYSGYIEIIDSVGNGGTLSAKFASYRGHIVGMIIESVSEVDTIYEVELSYGTPKVVITRWRFAGETKFTSPAHQLRVRAIHIPAGETVYYRMKSATAVANTALVHFRYFLHV